MAGLRVGDIDVLPVIDGVTRFRPTEAFPGTTDADWEPHRALLEADGMIEFALGGFLIRSGDRLALVDAGVGPVKSGPFRGGRFLESLAEHGVAPEDVTDVVFTHLHY